MMNNFLEFINKDIDAKTLLVSSMPIKTKPNQKKLNKTIDEYSKKYIEYKNSVKTYLLAKKHSLEVKTKDHRDEEENLLTLEQIKFLLNPSNTYFEKLGFDELLYQINNYYWSRVKLEDGTEGYIASQYLKTVENEPVSPPEEDEPIEPSQPENKLANGKREGRKVEKS